MYKAQTQVVYSRTNSHGNFTALLDVLSPNFWITIVAFMFIFFFFFIVTTKYSLTKSTIALAILDSAALIIKAFLGQAFDENVFLKTHYGLKKTFILQLQLLSLVGALVFWVYSGCLISFFTFSPSGPPINFINDLKDSPMKFYVQADYSTAFDQIKAHFKGSNIPKSIIEITDSSLFQKVLSDIANGVQGTGGIAHSQIWQKKISEGKMLLHCFNVNLPNFRIFSYR